MNKAIALIGSLLCAGAVAPASAAGRHREANPGLLSFGTMFGVDGAFVGEERPIRGVVGDELPWEIVGSARGRLDESGRLKISVRGLVFANDPSVPPDLRGKNDEKEFRALVSCLNDDGNTVNVVSAGFPATHQGDSDIDAQLEIPETCVAPIVFVLAGSEDKWFAVTGKEMEEQ